MLMGGLPTLTGGYQIRAQDDGGVVIGDPPVVDDFNLAGVSDPGSIELAAIPASVDLDSRASSRAFYNSYFVDTFPALNWTGNFASCAAGTISTAYKQAVVDQISWYRVMAGVPGTLALSSAWSTKAQQTAVMMGKAGSLSHFPDTSWPCYTAGGSEAAANSNIAYNYADPSWPPVDFVTQFMYDSGSNNRPVGHRRWFLFPQLGTVGVGTVGPGANFTYPSANAIWVIDGNYSSPRPATRDGFVAWPPPGYVPYQVVFPRWSFSYPGADFSGATVSVKRNGAAVTSSIEDRSSTGLGENSIVFLVGGASWNAPTTDVRYTVTINNVGILGSMQSFTYDVMIFDPALGGSGTLANASLTPSEGSSGDSVNYSISGFPANSSVAITWKTSASSNVNLGSVQTNSSGAASGSFTVPAGPGGVFPVVFTAGSTTAEAVFQVLPRLILLTPTSSLGGEVDIQVTGAGANQAFRVIWVDPESGANYLVADNLTTNANGHANVTLDVPWWTIPGPQEIKVNLLNPSVTISNTSLVILSDPPNAVTAGSLHYVASSLLTEIELDGSGSTGADGTIIEAWDWSIGGEPIASGEITSVELPVGTHNIVLTVTDEYGLTDTAPLVVTIAIGDQSAIANAGPDQQIPTSGATTAVTLDGSASAAAPGTTITSYSWTLDGQQSPIATGENPTVMLPNGLHTITLTVTTNFATISTDTVQIRVSEPPAADAGAGRTVDTWTTSAMVTLDGAGSTPPPGSSIIEYRWTGLPGGDLTGATPSVTLPVGSYTATLTVTASNGMTDTDTVSITINHLGEPTVNIDPDRAAPVANIAYEIANFPRGSEVSITWTTNHGAIHEMGTVLVSESNAASGSISVPAGPGGLGNFLTFSLDGISVSAEVEVRPRISPSVLTAAPGQTITVNLRGFARRDNVLIRWKVGDTYVNVGTATTSSTGSVTNKAITIPANAQGGLNTIRVQGTISQNTSTVTVVAPAVSVSPTRTTVNNWVTYEINNFPANSPVSITWTRLSGSTINMGTVNTDGSGSATGRFRVPATTGGPGQVISFSSGNVSRTAIFEVAPRVKVTPAPAGRGEQIDISLRGFERQENIRIRWRPITGGPWIVLATGRTSNTGSANIRIPVPDYAADGTYSLRAETASFNQQTNVVEIEGGNPVSLAAADTPTPETVPADEPTSTEIDRSALPLDAPVSILTISDDANTPDLRQVLTDANIATGWTSAPHIERNDARLTIDLGSAHTLRGFAWLTEAGGCGELTGLEYSLDGESWTAFDSSLPPGPIGNGRVWRYVSTGVDARFIRIIIEPETADQRSIGCIAEVAVWGTAIVVDETPTETPVMPEEPVAEVTPELTEETPVATEPTVEPAPEPEVEEPVETAEPSA